MKRSRLRTAGVAAGLCAVVGAAGGIVGSAAAPSGSHPTTSGARGLALHAGPMGFHRGPFGLGGPAVHSEAVVPNSAGTGFDTITTDNGTFKSLSGDQLTITEGTKTTTYKVVTLTIPGDATVMRNHATAKLADLADGDAVHVVSGPKGTLVLADDAAHQRAFDGGGRRRDHGPDGPMGMGFGPPPAGAR